MLQRRGFYFKLPLLAPLYKTGAAIRINYNVTLCLQMCTLHKEPIYLCICASMVHENYMWRLTTALQFLKCNYKKRHIGNMCSIFLHQASFMILKFLCTERKKNPPFLWKITEIIIYATTSFYEMFVLFIGPLLCVY